MNERLTEQKYYYFELVLSFDNAELYGGAGIAFSLVMPNEDCEAILNHFCFEYSIAGCHRNMVACLTH